MAEKQRTRKRLLETDAQWLERVNKYFFQEKEDAHTGKYPNYNQVHQRTADLSGFSYHTIKHHFSRSEKREGDDYLWPGEIERRSRPMEIEMDPAMTRFWVDKVANYLQIGYTTLMRWPTMGWIYQEIQREQMCTRFKWSQTTFMKFVERHHFSKKARLGYYDNLRSKAYVIAQRDAYVIKIKKYRERNLDIYYMDETWGSQNTDRKEGWCFDPIDDYDEDENFVYRQPIHPPPITSRNTGNDIVYLSFIEFSRRFLIYSFFFLHRFSVHSAWCGMLSKRPVERLYCHI
jgi:hypothetical protein